MSYGHRSSDNSVLLQKFITLGETWMYGYDIQTKTKSSQWNGRKELGPKEADQVRLSAKVLLSFFFDCNGVVHHEFLPQDRKVNREYYFEVMRQLCKAFC